VGSSQYPPWEAAIVAVEEDQPPAEEGFQRRLWEAGVVVAVQVGQLAELEDGTRLVDNARRAEAGEGIEDEDRVVGGGAAAEGKDRRAADSVDKMGVSTGVVAEVVVGSARQHAPWTVVWLEVEELD
jgi:hypothetical protein